MTKSEVIARLLMRAKHFEELGDSDPESVWVAYAQELYDAASMLKDCVTRRFFNLCLKSETNRRIKAEEKLKELKPINWQTAYYSEYKDGHCWYDASKKCPKCNGYYLIYIPLHNDAKDYEVAYFDTNLGWHDCEPFYWIPLPEIPEEGER